METFLINSGSVERVTENGRKYLVADATILVGDQVLNGSKGKLFYSSKRCALNVGEWNKQPIVLRHPTEIGPDGSTVPVAAHSKTGVLNEDIIRQFGMGEVRNDSWDGKHRRVKLWFDEEHTQNKSPETYQSLIEGKSIELSTGLFTVDKPVANGRSPSGDDYTHEVEDWIPDHLAILPDQVGACSRKMGCGVLNTSSSSSDNNLLRRIAEKLGLLTPTEVTSNKCSCEGGDEECTCADPKKCKAKKNPPAVNLTQTQGVDMSFDRTKTIQALTANCACWKGKEKVLNAMEDDALAILAKQSEELANNQLVINAVREELGVEEGEELTANAMPAFIQKKIDAKKKPMKKDGEYDEESEEGDEEEMTENVFKNFLKLPPEQRLTANEREALDFANEVKQRARTQLVDNLVSILGRTPERKAALKKKFSSMTVNQLREKLDELKELDIPAERPTSNHDEQDTVLDFLGAGGGFTGNRSYGAPEVDPNDILEPFYTGEPAAAK